MVTDVSAMFVDSTTLRVPSSEKGVRSAQKTQVGSCIHVGTQLDKPEFGLTSGPTRRLSHFGRDRKRELLLLRLQATVQHHHGCVAHRGPALQQALHLGFGRIVGSEIEAPNMLANMV
jgi:hypothetical protein